MPLFKSLGRAALLATLGLPVAAAVLVPTDAQASVSIAITFDQLCTGADSVAAITPGEATSNWENGRIFTYTKVHVDQGVAGELAAGQDTYVRTMGGVVGKIGQMVDGEAVFQKGAPSLLFLRKLNTGSYEVTARGQGQWPIQVDPKTNARTIIRSYAAGVLLPPKPKTPDSSAQASGVQTQSITPVANAPATNGQLMLRLASDVLHQRAFDAGTKDVTTNWNRLHAPAPTQTK